MPGIIGNLLGAGLFLDGNDLILAGGAFYKSDGNPNVQPSQMIFSLDLYSKRLNTNSHSEWNPLEISRTLKNNLPIEVIQGSPLTIISRPKGWRAYAVTAASQQVQILAQYILSSKVAPFRTKAESSLIRFDYDKTTNQLSQEKIDLQPVIGYSYCQRANGQIFMSGGLDSTGLPTNSFYLISSKKKLASGPYSMFHSSSCLDNEIVLLGGLDRERLRSFDKIDVYRYGSSWEVHDAFGNIPSPRYLHATATLPNGHIVISGGLGSQNQALSDLYLLNTDTWTWFRHDITLEPRFGHAIAILKEYLIIAQGWSRVPFKSRLFRRATNDPKLVVIDTRESPWQIVSSLDLDSPNHDSLEKTLPGGSHSSGSNTTGILIGTLVGGTLLVIILVILWFFLRRRKAQNTLSHQRLRNISGEKTSRLDMRYLDNIPEHSRISYITYPTTNTSRHLSQPLNAESKISCNIIPSYSSSALHESIAVPALGKQSLESQFHNMNFNNHSSLTLAHRFHPSELVEDRDLYDTGIALPEIASGPISSTHISSIIRTNALPTHSSSDSQFITVLSSSSHFSVE